MSRAQTAHRVVAVIVAAFSLCAAARAQSAKVANYSSGKAGTASYEHFSFWVRDGQRGEITYSYGKDWKEVKLTYAGADVCQGSPCFKVQFPNGRTLQLIRKGLSLKVVGVGSRYSKIFRWEYEGPVEGRGTFCDVCAEDETEAMRLMRDHFLK